MRNIKCFNEFINEAFVVSDKGDLVEYNSYPEWMPFDGVLQDEYDIDYVMSDDAIYATSDNPEDYNMVIYCPKSGIVICHRGDDREFYYTESLSDLESFLYGDSEIRNITSQQAFRKLENY
jgi:hypothetical protein